MAEKVVQLLVAAFDLPVSEQRILLKNIKQLDRQERKMYFSVLKRQEKIFKDYLQQVYTNMSPAERQDFFNTLVDSLLVRRGDPDLADCLAMDVLGRLKVYRALRQRAEDKGVRLTALNNFGGLSMVLMLFVIIAGLVLLLLAR
ncbi:MAG: hypothetical protein ACOY81_05995 [Bacillota bacterium]|uniref:hypothetical protein n=1 Tax=Desulfurispora thermophila TaxID=265470 RepID=UPI000365989A|nr:hypothetical protein [Desulfurispora thermophila]